MSKLFVYGIFLTEGSRSYYDMSNPVYAVVRGYATKLIHNYIVEAVPDQEYDLTGLLVDIPDNQWRELDDLERGYQRIEVQTTDGVRCFMYVAK